MKHVNASHILAYYVLLSG